MALKGIKKQILGSKKPVSYPTYEQMIKEAITTLKKRTGSSQYAIAKFMEEKYKHLSLGFRKILSYQLKRLVASEKLVKVKGSFKLPPKTKVTTPKPKLKPKPKQSLKIEQTETTNSTPEAKPKRKAPVINSRPFILKNHKSKPQNKSKQPLKAKKTKTTQPTAEVKPKRKAPVINSRPLNLRDLKSKPQSKPNPKPKTKQPLKAKKTKTTQPTDGAKPNPIAKSERPARHKALLIKAEPWTVKAIPKKGPVKATSKGKASARSYKP